MRETEKVIRQVLCETLGNDSPLEVDERGDLAPYGMDSLNCMCLAIALEEAFDIEIPEDKLGMRYVRNVYDICKLVEEVTVNG